MWVSSVREKEEDAIPLRFNFHGYYRARYNWIGNAPMPKGQHPRRPIGFPEQERLVR